ncbi:telomerase reverse transcriptase [Stemphylium lycopersici]|nr:telomerase reverse transcriptase [Stemphylium lycopersici]
MFDAHDDVAEPAQATSNNNNYYPRHCQSTPRPRLMKRKRSTRACVGTRKRARSAVDQSPNATPQQQHPHHEHHHHHHHHHHPVLQRLYPQVSTLRHYLLSRLPSSSKNRHRRISQLGRAAPAPGIGPAQQVDSAVVRLLDTALVGSTAHGAVEQQSRADQERDRDIIAFTQQRSQGTPGGTFKAGYYLQTEIVDFVIWRLFKRSQSYKPTHLLCHGFQRAGNARRELVDNHSPRCSIPGLQEIHVNSHVRTLKEPVWCRLHALLGQGGDRIMMNLLLDCSIFLPVEANAGNFYQLSGVPVSEVQPEEAWNNTAGKVKTDAEAATKSHLKSENRSPGAITFVRSRMLYAKAALNARGGIRFGMRHIHVLNRFPDRTDKQQTIHIMRYIFPRQFGLHNVFTSKVDARESAMPFKDYTLREKDIHNSMCRDLGDKATDAQEISKWKSRVPKRLRGKVIEAIAKLRSLNQRCSYMEMLRHYCPVEGVPLSPKPEWRKSTLQPKPDLPTTAESSKSDCGGVAASGTRSIQQISFVDMACPTAHVSAFCRAIISKVIPEAFWGSGHNKDIVMYWVDQFLNVRRFESFTLHQVTQKIRVSTIPWLCPPGQDNSCKLSKSDMEKRTELFLEFVYWLFDSFLTPLIRTNFHVTESNAHRNRLFYFRHDVWRMLAEPALTTLRMNMFEEMPMDSTMRLLSARQLGFSNIRLLPKKQGFRTIMNLKRRQQITHYGTMSLGRSINAVMTPAFNAITYEKYLRPDKFGCSLFSVGDMHPKLAAFKESLKQRGISDRRLYFAKVDVQACFDTIPQARLLRMIDSLLTGHAYHTGKHVEMSPLGPLQRLNGSHVNPMPRKKYVAHSQAATDTTPFHQLVQDRLAGTKANTIFANTNMQRCESKDDLMQLLREHIERNVVRIGKRFYRQKAGIPQGSVLSSILCNFFYAELERDVLDFALGDDCLLLRLLDDFLLISTTEEPAKRFIRVMHQGHPEYGVVVRAAKSLANFDVSIGNGERIATSGPDGKFPYCGICIDTATLEVSKKTERPEKAAKMPGQTFHRKALNISDATAPFAFARQQRGDYCAERHFAPATSVAQQQQKDGLLVLVVVVASSAADGPRAQRGPPLCTPVPHLSAIRGVLASRQQIAPPMLKMPAVQHHQQLPPVDEAGDSEYHDDHVHYISQEKPLYLLSEHSYVRSLIQPPCARDTCANHQLPPHRIGTPPRLCTQRKPPRPLMATLSYAQDAQSSFGAPPGSPPDLTNSKSSKSSSIHSSTLLDFMGTTENLSHFEDINLDEASGAPSSFPMPASPSNRVLFEAPRASVSTRSLPHSAQHSFRDLTGTSKPKYPSLKGQVNHAVQRQQAQLAAPGKQVRRGFTSPSIPSLSSLSLAAPQHSSRSPSPSTTHKSSTGTRTLSRRSSRNDVLPSPGLASRRQSWQDTKRKTVKEREAECDDEDDELPEDAVIWNIPISPRPTQERSPASWMGENSPQTSPQPGTIESSSSKTSPAPPMSRHSQRTPSPNVSSRGVSPQPLAQQNTWADTYTALDPDARILTEKLEEFQSEFERKQEITRQQPGLAKSATVSQPEPKSKKPALPPVRKSDPLIDPFQPSIEKQKYLSRTRPSWLPPKNPKEEKKHLKEYQRMLARIEEAERLEAQRAQEEALAREKASRIKAEYWSTLLIPNWATEMTNSELRASHRKMWWNGIPPRLRGQVWAKAIGNDLEVTETTYSIALEKARKEVKTHGHEALGGRYLYILESTNAVFPELKMFAPAVASQTAASSPSSSSSSPTTATTTTTTTTVQDEQPLHRDLVDVCLAYSMYRPDIPHSSFDIHHIAALLLLNLPAPQAFITLSNLLNRPLPLSFLVHDQSAIHAAYSTTLHVLAKKAPSLASRLETLRVEPRDYLFHALGSLFCGRLGVEHAARIMDVVSIEGDKNLPRAAVAILSILEGACMEGDAESVARVLREKKIEGDVDEFIAKVFEAGKSS